MHRTADLAPHCLEQWANFDNGADALAQFVQDALGVMRLAKKAAVDPLRDWLKDTRADECEKQGQKHQTQEVAASRWGARANCQK
jgi:hypothetical protein